VDSLPPSRWGLPGGGYISSLRAVITGVDGAGKSTTAGFVVNALGHEYRIAKPGPSRPFYTMVDGNKRYYYQNTIKLIDRLHAIADRSHRPDFVGAVNAINVILNGRVVEPDFIRRVKPELVLGARDFYIDPAVYSVIYSPRLGKKPMNERIDTLKRITGAPYRDIIFFLTVPPEEAISRIEGRIAAERLNPNSTEREKWRHMHEQPDILNNLQMEYYNALNEVQKRHPVQIYEINTSGILQSEVVDSITHTIKTHLENRTLERGSWIVYDRNQEVQRT